MSPEPNVRGQAFAVALLLVTAAVLGSPMAALICSLVGAAGAWGLYVRFKGDLVAARERARDRGDRRDVPPLWMPPHRERLDRIVAGDARAALAIGLIASVVMVGFGVDPVRTVVVPATPVLLAVAALGVYLSSLFDWYVILPRMSGLLGTRPCREPTGEHPRFPRTWRDTTQWWYVHRIVAVVVLWYGLSFALVLSVEHHISVWHGTTIVSGAALGFLASYRKALPWAGMQVGHPTMIVGQTVRRRATRSVWRTASLGRRTVKLPWRTRRLAGAPGERVYVCDVAVEKVQVIAVIEREQQVPVDANGEVCYARDLTDVQPKDVAGCEPARPFSGCSKTCSGINWYCIENPNCFATK